MWHSPQGGSVTGEGEGGGTGINGSSVCNGEECGCWPGI